MNVIAGGRQYRLNRMKRFPVVAVIFLFQFTVVHKFEFFGGWAGLLWTRSTGLLRLTRLIDLQVAWAPGAGVPLPPWRNVPPHHLGLPVLVNPRVTEA